MQYTHYLTWLTLGEIESAIATPVADGREVHAARVEAAIADYPNDENGERPDVTAGKTFLATDYDRLPHDLLDVALSGSEPDLQHIGHEDHGPTWYGRAA